MSNIQLSLNIFSKISEKIMKFYNEYAKIVEKIDSNQEIEKYNFDLW